MGASKVRFSISEYTTFGASFEDDLAAYRAAGCDGIGVIERKLPENGTDLLQESGLTAVCCFPNIATILPLPAMDVPMDPGPVEPEERIAAICASVRRLAALEPELVYFLTGPLGDYELSDAKRIVREGAAAIADAGAAAGVRVGIETVHPDQGFGAFTHTFADTLDAIGTADVGLILDTWHVNDVDEIRTYADKIVAVQLADRREPNRSHLDRVLPGDGVLDIPAILRVLDDAGYDGWYEIEIVSDDGTFGNSFPDSLWALEPSVLARKARASFDRVWQARLDVA